MCDFLDFEADGGLNVVIKEWLLKFDLVHSDQVCPNFHGKSVVLDESMTGTLNTKIFFKHCKVLFRVNCKPRYRVSVASSAFLMSSRTPVKTIQPYVIREATDGFTPVPVYDSSGVFANPAQTFLLCVSLMPYQYFLRGIQVRHCESLKSESFSLWIDSIAQLDHSGEECSQLWGKLQSHLLTGSLTFSNTLISTVMRRFLEWTFRLPLCYRAGPFKSSAARLLLPWKRISYIWKHRFR